MTKVKGPPAWLLFATCCAVSSLCRQASPSPGEDGLKLPSLTLNPVPAGRVPAGNTGLVGIKPSVGRVSTTGVVPACYLLDCVSVFALSVGDGAEVARLMENANIAGQWGGPWAGSEGHRAAIL